MGEVETLERIIKDAQSGLALCWGSDPGAYLQAVGELAEERLAEIRAGLLPPLKFNRDLLRDQRDSVLTAIDDAEDFAEHFSETRGIRTEQAELLGGLVSMLDEILDATEVEKDG